MRRAVWGVVGMVVASVLLWLIYELLDRGAMRDAQSVLLFVPTAIVGGMGGYALAAAQQREANIAARELAVAGVASLVVVSLFVWMGTQVVSDIPSRLLSPWCAVPGLIGGAELALAMRIKHK